MDQQIAMAIQNQIKNDAYNEKQQIEDQKQLEAQKRLEATQKNNAPEKPSEPAPHYHAIFDMLQPAASRLRNKRGRGRKGKRKHNTPSPPTQLTLFEQYQKERANEKNQLPEHIQWKAGLPTYTAGDQTCPIQSLYGNFTPQGIYYAYIDRQALSAQGMSPKHLQKFNTQLEKSKIIYGRGEQGIKFYKKFRNKIIKLKTLGNQGDERILGRVVDTQTIELANGKERTVHLICFDTRSDHKQEQRQTKQVLPSNNTPGLSNTP